MQRHLLFPLLALPLLAVSPARAQMAAPAVLPPVVSIGAAAVPELMDALLQQKISPRDLWNSGRLNGDSLVAVLNEQPWGRTENQPQASQLCTLLVEKAPEKLKDPLALPPRTRLRLAQYFKSIKDARAVTFYEAILSLIKAPPREAGVVEVFELSDYYTAIGDWQKAAETRLRMKDYTTAEPFIANANVEAARMYVEHGQPEKAQPLYERAEKSSYGWAAGVAFIDHGRTLMEQTKYDEAIKVLSAPVTGLYSDQILVALLAFRGFCYYQTANFQLAIKDCQSAIDKYNELSNPLQGEGLEGTVNLSKLTLMWSKLWMENPIRCSAVEVKMNSRDDSNNKTTSVTQHLFNADFTVQCFKKVPLVISCDDPQVRWQIQPQQADPWKLGGDTQNYYVEWHIQVQAPSSMQKNANLRISSSDFPQSECKVLLRVKPAENN